MWWCQIIDWLYFETRPSSLQNFGMANCHKKIPQFCSSTRADKNCHIQIARVDGREKMDNFYVTNTFE